MKSMKREDKIVLAITALVSFGYVFFLLWIAVEFAGLK